MACSRRLLALLGPALLLGGCVQEATVDVTRTGGAVAIAVARPGAAKPPCVQSLNISTAGSDIADAPPLWELATAEPGRCQARFIYGQVPQGYSQSGPAPDLTAGNRYLVEISGPGLISGREFTMRPDDGPMTEAATP